MRADLAQVHFAKRMSEKLLAMFRLSATWQLGAQDTGLTGAGVTDFRKALLKCGIVGP